MGEWTLAKYSREGGGENAHENGVEKYKGGWLKKGGINNFLMKKINITHKYWFCECLPNGNLKHVGEVKIQNFLQPWWNIFARIEGCLY